MSSGDRLQYSVTCDKSPHVDTSESNVFAADPVCSVGAVIRSDVSTRRSVELSSAPWEAAMAIDHVTIKVKDLAKARAFYEAALAPLGYKVHMEWEGKFVGLGA